MRPGVAVAVESGGSLLVRADEEHVPAPARAAVAGGAGVGGGAHLVGSLAPVVLRELLEAGVAEGQHQLGAAGVAARRRAGAAVLRRLVAALGRQRGHARLKVAALLAAVVGVAARIRRPHEVGVQPAASPLRAVCLELRPRAEPRALGGADLLRVRQRRAGGAAVVALAEGEEVRLRPDRAVAPLLVARPADVGAAADALPRGRRRALALQPTLRALNRPVRARRRLAEEQREQQREPRPGRRRHSRLLKHSAQRQLRCAAPALLVFCRPSWTQRSPGT